jgi:hypothetical protein
VYHYVADRHQLELVRLGITSRQIQRCLGYQWYFAKAAAVVFMTAMMARTQWTYAYARAYRSILAETGHVCQTFCLVATWLKLAPFCTMALADSVVEKLLKVDGVQETVLYAAGVGLRPAAGWTQWPDHEPGNPYMPSRRRDAHAAEREILDAGVGQTRHRARSDRVQPLVWSTEG